MLLPDIERGPTWTEHYKRICLLRWVAKMRKGQRQAFYQMWAKRHGVEAARQLSRDVAEQWREDQQS